MEERKLKEIEYYNKEARSAEEEIKEAGGLANLNPLFLASYKFLYKLLEKNCQGKKVLDYGCGSGIHLSYLSKISKEVIGIDLSQKSLEIARKKIEKENIKNAKVVLMDCEKMDFPDSYFDIVFDGGTFSSIDLDKALPEIIKVLKPDGCLIGIETFGHNPFTNLKRLLNKKAGKRTEWAAEHIFKMKDLKTLERFGSTEALFFHLISWIVFPLLNLPGGKIMLKILEGLDEAMIAILPFFKKYAFKVVFIVKKDD